MEFDIDVKKRSGEFAPLVLAYIGDAVYELMTRVYLAESGKETNRGLHRAAVEIVSAPAQALAMERLMPMLTEEEAEVFRRGRNAHVNGIPPKATPGEYHAATGLEALFGFLYLRGERERLNQLFSAALEGGK